MIENYVQNVQDFTNLYTMFWDLVTLILLDYMELFGDTSIP